MQQRMTPQVGYAPQVGGARPLFRPQYRRHSLAPEVLLPQSVRATPAIAINGSKVHTATAYALPARAQLPTMASTTVLSRQYLYNNNRRFSSSASLQGAVTSNGTTTMAGANGAMPITPGAHIVAIDSKIEQAMDLVKTHLMFAVREEVELLRTKILELESAVIHLEAENSILREHVPQDVLQSLQPGSGGNGLASSAIGAAIQAQHQGMAA